jgi:hypothetical protein
MNPEGIGDFLQQIHGQIRGLREARKAYAPRFAPSFNALELLRPDEMRLSGILAELLNPEGRHAQGWVFWNLFARQFELNAVMDYPNQVEIKTEVPTDALEGNENRRIDILAEIDGKTRALAIENKPWAADQQRQIADYLDHLQSRYKNGFMLVYLSGGGSPPGDNSIAKDERDKAMVDARLRVVPYGELIPWLERCRSQCTAPKVSDFLREFEEYIRGQFMGNKDMTERNAVINAALKSAETIGAAMEIVRASTEIRESLCEKLANDVRQRLAEDKELAGVHLMFQDKLELEAGRWWNKWEGFTFLLGSEKDRHGLRFQFDKHEFNGFNFGIADRNQENQHDLPDDVRKVLNENFGISLEKQQGSWAWWHNLGEPLRKWGNEVEPWVQIKNGELAEKILENVRRVYRALKQVNLIDKLR